MAVVQDETTNAKTWRLQNQNLFDQEHDTDIAFSRYFKTNAYNLEYCFTVLVNSKFQYEMGCKM